jgi:RNase P subunit RPR2
MSYTHTSIPVELTEQAFCDDCGNPLPAGALARRRVTDTGKRGFKIDWICAGACGPIIDVSDNTLMRKRIAQLEEEVSRARHDREVALELAQQSQDEANLVIVMLESQRDELRFEWERIADTLERAEQERDAAGRECDRLREQLDAKDADQ